MTDEGKAWRMGMKEKKCKCFLLGHDESKCLL